MYSEDLQYIRLQSVQDVELIDLILLSIMKMEGICITDTPKTIEIVRAVWY